MQAVRDAWGRIVDGVRQAHTSLGSFLQEGQPGQVEGHVLRILFAEAGRFNMTQVEKNRAVVEEICEQVLGVKLRVQCAIGSSEAAPGAAVDGPSRGAGSGSQDRKSDTQVDPAVKSVLDTFDGELV